MVLCSCRRAVCSSRMAVTWSDSGSGSPIWQALGCAQLGSGSSVSNMIEGQVVDIQKGLNQVMPRSRGAAKQQVFLPGARTTQIRILKDEIVHQGVIITKLCKEKRGCVNGCKGFEEDIPGCQGQVQA